MNLENYCGQWKLWISETDKSKFNYTNRRLRIKTTYKLNKDNCKIDFNKSGRRHACLLEVEPYPTLGVFIKIIKEITANIGCRIR
jgi:methionyl-tRNA formyltransferase